MLVVHEMNMHEKNAMKNITEVHFLLMLFSLYVGSPGQCSSLDTVHEMKTRPQLNKINCTQRMPSFQNLSRIVELSNSSYCQHILVQLAPLPHPQRQVNIQG